MCARSSSDDFYKLVKTLSGGVFSMLKRHNDVYAEDSAQWRLIEANWKRDSFDPEKDAREFGAHKVPMLKYRARRWLIKTLPKVSHYPRKDILDLLEEAHTAIYREDFPSAAIIIEEAKAVAYEKEYFRELLELLELEGEIICEVYPREEWDRLILANEHAYSDALAKFDNLNRLLRVRNLLERPLAKAYEKDTTFPGHLMDALENSPILQDLEVCISVRARHQFHATWVVIRLMKDEVMAAHGHCQALTRLYANNPWMSEENIGQYLGHLQGMVGLECLMGNQENAIALLGHFLLLDMEDPFVVIKSTPWLIRSKFNIANNFEASEQAIEAIELWDRYSPLLRLRLPEKTLIHFDYCSAKHCIMLGRYREAKGYLQRVYDFDLKTRQVYKPHVRALETICVLALDDNLVEIENQAALAARFIRRQPVPNAIPQLAVQLIIRLARSEDNLDSKIVAIEEFASRLEVLVQQPENSDALSFFDYRAWAVAVLSMVQNPSRMEITVKPPPATTL